MLSDIRCVTSNNIMRIKIYDIPVDTPWTIDGSVKYFFAKGYKYGDMIIERKPLQIQAHKLKKERVKPFIKPKTEDINIIAI